MRNIGERDTFVNSCTVLKHFYAKKKKKKRISTVLAKQNSPQTGIVLWVANW